MVIVEAAPISPRSSATTQAESDETEGDFREGIEVSVQFTGARTSNVADILSRAMGEDDQENAKSILCISNTKHVKVSFTMMILFAVITVGQLFAAEAANSQSLKVDVVAMSMDAVSYIGNIIGGRSDFHVPVERIVLQLCFSFLSLLLLNYYNTSIFMESINIVTGDNRLEGERVAKGVNAAIVFVFALLGLIVDFVCMYAYRYYARKIPGNTEERVGDVDRAVSEIHKVKIKMIGKDAESCDETKSHPTEVAEIQTSQIYQEKAAEIQKPQISMFGARSSYTLLIEAIVLFAITPANQEYVDAIYAIFIGVTIYGALIYAFYIWCKNVHCLFIVSSGDTELESRMEPDPSIEIEFEPERPHRPSKSLPRHHKKEHILGMSIEW